MKWNLLVIALLAGCGAGTAQHTIYTVPLEVAGNSGTCAMATVQMAGPKACNHLSITNVQLNAQPCPFAGWPLGQTDERRSQ